MQLLICLLWMSDLRLHIRCQTLNECSHASGIRPFLHHRPLALVGYRQPGRHYATANLSFLLYDLDPILMDS